jgi:hemoglobin
MRDVDVFDAIGEDGFTRLVAAFYRQVPSDDVLGPMYPAHDLAGAETRLRDFLVGRFGGPRRYIEQRGHPRLRARHLPFPIDDTARNRWLLLMERAFAEAGFPADVERTLREFFRAVAAMMITGAEPTHSPPIPPSHQPPP